MTEIQQLQKKALEILKDFDNFCVENNLRYFVIGGACIGIARSGKLIPWDDDIDIFMPRPDYEKLTEIWPHKGDKEKYTLCRTTKEENFHSIVTLLKDNNSTFINSHSVDQDIHHGYMIDILPIDGLAPTKFKQMVQFFNAAVFSLFNAQRLPDNQGGLVRTFAKILYFLFPSNNVKYKLWKRAEKNMIKYDFDSAEMITELASGFRYMGKEYDPKIFSDVAEFDVEGTTVKLPIGYKEYLTIAFGDYTKIPPKEDQIPKHNVVFMDMNTPYYEYKGIHYLKGDKK